MCGGICGPAGEMSGYSRYAPTKKKSIKQRKVPYTDASGNKIVACWEGTRQFVKLYKSKKHGEWIASWSSVLSSGAAVYKNKSNAISEYNQKVPDKYKIKK